MPSDEVYEYMSFRGSVIKNLQVKSSPPGSVSDSLPSAHPLTTLSAVTPPISNKPISTISIQTEKPSLVTPRQLLHHGKTAVSSSQLSQIAHNPVSSSQSSQIAHKDVEVVQASPRASLELPVAVSNEAQPPLLPLPQPHRTAHKDSQVKSSPPVQPLILTAPSINSDPAIIQSHYPHQLSTSSNMLPASSMSLTDHGPHTLQAGQPGPNYQGNLPLYQPGGNMPWGNSPPLPSSTGGGHAMLMYCPGYYALPNGLPQMHQQSLLRPPPGLLVPPSMQQPMQFSGFNASLESGGLPLPEYSSTLLPATNSFLTLNSKSLPSGLSPLGSVSDSLPSVPPLTTLSSYPMLTTDSNNVNVYMLDLTFKMNFPKRNPKVPDFPLFAIHSLNLGNYQRSNSKLVIKCNDSKDFPKLPRGSISNKDMPDMIKFWPSLKKGLGFYDNWSYQNHKHGSHARFRHNFLKTTLYLGKMFILSIQDFMTVYGYAAGGMYNCQKFLDDIREDMDVKVRVVYGWHKKDQNAKGEPPALLKLFAICILFEENLRLIDFEQTQSSSIKDLSKHHFYLPELE